MINFKKYDSENPQIWEQFKKYAFQAKVKGFTNYSAKGIFEIIRWHTAVSGNDAFKLNNNYHADYARKMMQEFPLFAGFFRVRELKASRRTEQLKKIHINSVIGKDYLDNDGNVVTCVEGDCVGCCFGPNVCNYVYGCGDNMFQKHDKSQHLSR